MSPRALSNASIFALSALCMALEGVQLRVFSYTMDPHAVFGAIAMAMLGAGAAAALLAARPSLLTGGAARLLPACAAGFGASAVASMALFARLSPLVVPSSLVGVALTEAPAMLLCALPYAFAGLGATALLSESPERAHELTLSGLLGSALGCLAIYPLLRPLGVEALLATLGLLGALPGLALALATKQPRASAAAAAAALLAAAALARPAAFFPFVSDPGDVYTASERTMARFRLPPLPGAAPGKRAARLFSSWDPVSRVEVFAYPGPLDLVNDEAPLRLLLHDGGAGSLLVDLHDHPAVARSLFEGTTYGGAYALRPAPERALVIGLGGGLDVQTARYFGAKHITGVEVNGSTLRAADAFAGLRAAPDLELLHLDGRSFVESTRQKYDVIQLSGADTYSASGSGAFVFSESYLYTVEALERYLQALEPRGVLAIIRFGPEPLRLLVTGSVAARAVGIEDIRPHLAILRQGLCEVVLLSRSPLDEEQRMRLVQRVLGAGSLPPVRVLLNVAMGLGGDGTMPPLELSYLQGVREDPVYAPVLAAGAVGQAPEAVEMLEYDVTPTYDDRPFFFQFLRPSQLERVLSAPAGDVFARGLQGHLLALLTLCAASAALLLAPLLLAGNRPRLAGSPRPLGYFAATGAAYLLIEVALMQQTALFLGHPAPAIAVTLGALLTWSGVGSLLAGRSSLPPSPLVTRATAGIAVVIVVYLLGLRPLLALLLPLPLLARGALLFALLAPLGLLMGVPFPAGLRASAHRGEGLLAWAQAAGSLASVVASLLAAPLAMLVGFRAVLLLAVLLYGAAAHALRTAEAPASAGLRASGCAASRCTGAVVSTRWCGRCHVVMTSFGVRALALCGQDAVFQRGLDERGRRALAHGGQGDAGGGAPLLSP